MNTLKYDETRTSRSFEARLTDNAVRDLGESIGGAFGWRLPDHRPRRRPTEPMVAAGDASQLELPSLPSLAPPTETNVIDAASSVAAVREDIWRVFRNVDNRLTLDDTRLKATNSQADKVKRLTYLHLLALEAMGRDKASRAELVELAKELDLYSTNWSKVLKNVNDLEVNGDDVRLRLTGRKLAEQFLSQVLDDNIPDEWPITRGSSSRQRGVQDNSSRNSTKADHGVPRRSSGRPSKVHVILDAWRERGPSVPSHDVILNWSVAEKGLFGLWAIREVMGDDGKAVSRGILSQFLWEAFEVTVAGSSLADALRTASLAKDKVTNISGATFQINPTGIAYVRAMISGKETTPVESPNGTVAAQA